MYLSIFIHYVCLCIIYVRFNLKVRSQGLLKHVPAVHARGNKWGASVFLSTKVSVLKFPCARWHSCYSKRVCMHCHADDLVTPQPKPS